MGIPGAGTGNTRAECRRGCRAASCSAIVEFQVMGQPYAGELPSGHRREKIAVSTADMGLGGCAGTAPQHHLITHELSVVFAFRPLKRAIAWIGRIGT